MSVERTYTGDGPDCGTTWTDGTLDSCPGLLIVQESGPVRREHHFCAWDCVMKFAAQFPAARSHSISRRVLTAR